ncbi:MAG: ribosomal protein S18-alanine N-acetyltransferase [Firmicutes bacterium]|nr:ribosomal protein S18-alanine N-acetyltransferase [Bacillota bacterium]MDH7494540.1 ribosomal protein S18-alanine N-acetyltransferase [Bacillota bacterium]
MDVEISPMRQSDLDDVMRIEKASFPTPWSRNAFLSEIYENSRACYLVARQSGKVIGYVGIWIILEEGHITNIAVHPDFRRRGIGERLMKAIMDYARSKGAKRFTLEVRVSNVGAQKLYEKLGFVSAGIRPGYYHDNGEDAMIMWRNEQRPRGRPARDDNG